MIDYAAGEPPYVQVAGITRDRIATGTYASRLPSEKALAQELGVAIGTVRKAMSLLKAEGLIYTIRGWGTFVSGAGPGPQGLRENSRAPGRAGSEQNVTATGPVTAGTCILAGLSTTQRL